MVNRIRIQVWEETIELSQAFSRLQQAGLEQKVEQIVLEQLILERSFRDYHILQDISPSQAEKMMSKHRETLSEEQVAKLDAEIKESPEAARHLLSRLLADERLKVLKAKIIPFPMVQDAFLALKAQREGVLFQLLRVSDKALAREIYFRVQHDQHDFDRLVRQYGEGPEMEHGGLVGPIPFAKLKPDLQKQIHRLSPGEYTKPFTSDTGHWLVIRLLKQETMILTSEVEAQLRDNLFANWIQQQTNLASSLPGSLSQSHVTLMNQEMCKR